jgi:tetratricopeptide (TPR) repeat protein
LGDINKAENEIIKATKILKQANYSFKDQGFYYYVLAKIYFDKGLFDEALKNINSGIEFEKNLPLDGATIANFILQSEILYKQEKIKEASIIANKMCQSALKIYKDPDHEILARILLVVIRNMIGLRDFDAAKQDINKCERIYNLLYMSRGVFNSDVGLLFQLKGNLAFEQNKFSDAIEFYNKAEEIYDNVLIKKESDDISDLYLKMGLAYLNAGNKKKGYIYLKQNYTIFGLRHPRTIKIINYLSAEDLPMPW